MPEELSLIEPNDTPEAVEAEVSPTPETVPASALTKEEVREGLTAHYLDVLQKNLVAALALPDGNQKRLLAERVARNTRRLQERREQRASFENEIANCKRSIAVLQSAQAALEARQEELVASEVAWVLERIQQGETPYDDSLPASSTVSELETRVLILKRGIGRQTNMRIQLEWELGDCCIEELAEEGSLEISISDFGVYLTSEFASEAQAFQGQVLPINVSQGFSGVSLRRGRELLARASELRRDRNNVSRMIGEGLAAR